MIDFTPMTLAASQFQLALMRQKLAVKRMAFIFELAFMEALHTAYLEDFFRSQEKHSL